MAFNIMEMIANQITPNNLQAVAGMLDEDQGKVNSAFSGATPAILAGLVSSFSKPGGRQTFERQVEQADEGLPGNLASMLGGGGGNSLVNSGDSMLSMLLGNNSMGLLASTLGKFSGLSESSCRSLLGLATPLLLGMLKRKGTSDGLSSGGLADLLIGQKDNIAGALPAQVRSALSGSGLLEGVVGKATGAAAATATTTAATGKQAADKGGSLLSKLLPLIVLAVVVWLAYQFLAKPREEAATLPAVESVGTMQLSEQLGDLIVRAGSVLSGINSAEDASAALAPLQTVDQGLEQLLNASARLPSEQTQSLRDSFSKLEPELERAVRHAYDIPGAREILATTVDSILRKLKVISGN